MKNKRSTFSILFYVNTGKLKKTGKCPIMGRISVDGGNKAFSTGIDIFPSCWDSRTGTAIGKSEDIRVINKRIETYKTETARYYRDLVENHGYVTAELLKNAVCGIGISPVTVMQEFSAFMDEKRRSVGIKISNSTYSLYLLGYRHFRNFLQEKYGLEDIPFEKVDIGMIENYAYYLKIELRLSACSLHSYMTPLRSVVRRAFNRKLLRREPFTDYVKEKIINRRRWLSGKEIERLIQVEMPNHPTWIFIRDMFLFSTFTGISFIDLKNLKHGNIQLQEDGSNWIVLSRQKTGTTSCIPLLDFPLKILEKYHNTRFSGKDGKIFLLPSHVNMNLVLKKLAVIAGIDKHLTFHMSRHSFATSVCLTNGVPIETLSQMMGHLSIKTTQIYARVTRTKINEDMNNLKNRIEGRYVWGGENTNNQ